MSKENEYCSHKTPTWHSCNFLNMILKTFSDAEVDKICRNIINRIGKEDNEVCISASYFTIYACVFYLLINPAPLKKINQWIHRQSKQHEPKHGSHKRLKTGNNSSDFHCCFISLYFFILSIGSST